MSDEHPHTDLTLPDGEEIDDLDLGAEEDGVASGQSTFQKFVAEADPVEESGD